MRLFLGFFLVTCCFFKSLAQLGCPQDFDPSPNLIKNPGFEENFQGFVTDYKKSTSNTWFSGSIYVTDKPSSVHNNYRLCLDTVLYKDLGKMLIVDGSENRAQIVWQQTVKIEPNTDYYFALFFATLLKPNPAQLEISINGQRLPKPFDYRYQHCKGSTYFCFWNSSQLSQATLTIRTSTTDLMGNDYVLDNLQFFACKRKEKTQPFPPPKKLFDSAFVKIKVTGTDSVIPYTAKLSAQDSSATQSLLPDSNGNLVISLKNKPLLLSIHAKGYFPFKDTLYASPPYKDSALFKACPLIPIDSGSKFILKDLTFERSSHNVTEASKKELATVIDLLKENTDIQLLIQGHTDNQGDALKNYELSVERVNSVIVYLVENGISQERLKGEGFGGTKPLVGFGTEEERRPNRRVEFTVIKKRH